MRAQAAVDRALAEKQAELEALVREKKAELEALGRAVPHSARGSKLQETKVSLILS